MRSFSFDRMNNADLDEVAQASIGLVGNLQEHNKEAQVLGLATAFMVVCRHLKVHPSDAFRACTNMIATRKGESRGFKALELYVENEI